MLNVSEILKTKSLLVTLFVVLSSTFALAGGANGGGGFQYPNSKALLKKVSSELANDILKMDNASFKNFPPELSRDNIARIIREVKYLSDADYNEERVNPDGEYEGLMFNYYRNFGGSQGGVVYPIGYAIAALQPFFETYRALPMKQLAEKNFKSELFELTAKEIRQRLLHEVGHFLNIGVGRQDDTNGDVFAERILKARMNQYVRCEALTWMTSTVSPDTAITWYGFLLHRSTGQVAHVYDTWSTTHRVGDRAGNITAPPKPDVNLPSEYYIKYLDQLEKNGARSDSQLFYSSPLPDNFRATITPNNYVNDGEHISWLHKENDGDAIIKIDLTSGTSIMTIPYTKYPARTNHTQDVPMKCRSTAPVIEYADLITGK